MKSLWNGAIVLLIASGVVWLFLRGREQPPTAQPLNAPVQTVADPPPAPSVGSPAESPPAAVDDSRTQELLRANAALDTDPDLAERYRDIDARYFHRALPPIVIRWEPGLQQLGASIAEGFRLEGVTDARVILLNPAIQSDPQELRRALCHEMVHVAVWTQDRGHGPVFQRFLRDVADQGGFEGLVATDEDKQALRDAIGARAAALKAEAEALGTARAEIDAAEPGVRAYRAPGFNTQVQEYNVAVGEFNRLVERYNLMIVYPDGLDRERVARGAVLSSVMPR